MPYTVVVDAWLSGNKRGKSVVTVPFLTASLRALTRILKTGVQDSHLAKSRSPTGKSGSPTPKKLESHQSVHTVNLFHFSWK